MAKQRKKPGKVGENKSEVVAAIPKACSDETAAIEFMEQQRWEDCPCCPHCGDTDVYKMTGRDGNREKNYRWRCRGCGKLYSVRTGTVLEESRIPVRHWCYAFWRACSSKKGVSALEIQRQTGLSYKSALFLMHRIRWAMAPTYKGPKLNGTVEIDETYVGGKPRYRLPQSKVLRGNQRSNYQTRGERKTPVFAAVQRDGGVRVRVLPRVTEANLRSAILANVNKASRVMTDQSRLYKRLKNDFPNGHEKVDHSQREYVRGDVTTNTVEGFFSLLKRGIHGIYHNVSRKHLQRYCDEFEFRYNHRNMEDGERTVAAIQGAVGKRLRYKQPA